MHSKKYPLGKKGVQGVYGVHRPVIIRQFVDTLKSHGVHCPVIIDFYGVHGKKEGILSAVWYNFPMVEFITFKADTSALRKYALLFETAAPKQTRWAVASVLNDIAFNSRTEALDVIDDHMDVRNKGFVRSHVRVDKANGRQEVAAQEAWMGSTAEASGDKTTFTGWVEQQLGEPREQKRTHGIRARGNKKRRVRAKYKSGKTIPHSGDSQFRGRSTDAPWVRTWRMLHMLRRSGWIDKPFFIQKTSKIKSGTYRMTPGGKLRYIGTIAQAKNVGRLPWAELAVQKALKKNNVHRLWFKHYIRQLQKKYRRR